MITFKFAVGDLVKKKKGYQFPGMIVSCFINSNYEIRYVVEATDENFKYMLHIFNEDQLEIRNAP